MSIKVASEAYCTLEDVQQLLPNRKYDQDSKPTLEQAEESVKDIASEINVVIRGLNFTLPITNIEDIRFLKGINRLGAAWLMESSTMVAGQGQSQIIDNYKSKYDDMLEKLREGAYKLPSQQSPAVTDPDGNDDLDSSGERPEPIFGISVTDRETQF